MFTITEPTQLQERIAKIERTSLGWEDHGIFTCMLHLNYGGSGQGAGGYGLDRPAPGANDSSDRAGTDYGLEFIMRVMQACGVREWDEIKGRTIIALTEGRNGFVRGIKPLPTEQGRQFIFAEVMDKANA